MDRLAERMRRRGHTYREIAEALGISQSTAHARVNGRKFRPYRPKRFRLSTYGEIRALARLAAKHQPEAPGLWHKYGRTFTMLEQAEIEIHEPTITVEDGMLINLDADTSRQLYALSWERFEKALIEVNALYNEKPDTQVFHFNRVKRLLWEVDDLKRYIDTIYRMTQMPDELIEDDA